MGTHTKTKDDPVKDYFSWDAPEALHALPKSLDFTEEFPIWEAVERLFAR